VKLFCRSSIAAVCVMTAVPRAIAVAQQMTGVPAVDSATIARAAWARASTALGRGDVNVARQEIDRAAESWPAQPAYLWARAVIAARANDSAATFDALRQYAALGLGRDLRAEKSLASFAGTPVFETLVASHDANRAPIVRSRVRATLSDSTFWPEGMDFDSRTQRFYVASIRHRTIAEIGADGKSRELWPRGQSDLGAVFGVRVDTARGVLWATTSGIPQTERYVAGDSAIAALLRVRISDGTIEKRWDLPAIAGGHVLGDLAVGPAGDVFVTDSNDPVLYRLRPGSDTLEAIRHPLFHSLQGLAPTPDGKTLFLADYSHGLLRVDLATNVVTRLGDAPHSTSLGCDGIAWDGDAIVAVQNGVTPARIVRFVLDPSWRRISRVDVLDQNSSVADEPTIGAVIGREFVYVANGQFEKYDESGRRVVGKALTRPILLSVPLPLLLPLPRR
jgi:sugar lactone lactonase YvrE